MDLNGRIHQVSSAGYIRKVQQRSNRFVVEGSDDAAADTALLQEVATKVNASNQDCRVIFRKRLRLNANVDFQPTRECVFEGEEGAVLACDGANAQITFGEYFNVLAATTIAINATVAGQTELIGTGLGSLTPGTKLAVIGDDVLETAHSATLAYAPMEVVEVGKPTPTASGSSTTNVQINGSIHDALTVNPRVAVIPAMPRVICKNFDIENVGSVAALQPLVFLTASGIEVENIKSIAPAAGQFLFSLYYNARIHGCDFQTKLNPDVSANQSPQGYGIVSGVGTGLHISGNSFAFMRHGFTTGPGYSSTGVRHGTPRDTLIESNIIQHGTEYTATPVNSPGHGLVGGDVGSRQTVASVTGQLLEVTDGDNVVLLVPGAHPSLDCHAEGANIIIRKNMIRMPAAVPNTGAAEIGILSRARDVLIEGNDIVGPPGSAFKGIEIWGPRNKVIRNNMKNGWIGVRTNEFAFSSPAHDTEVRDNDFESMSCCAVEHKSGDRLKLVGNKGRDIGSLSPNAIFDLETGTDHEVVGNRFPKGPNSKVVHLAGISASAIAKYVGNTASGYDLCGIGFDLGTADGRQLDAKFRSLNDVEPGRITTISGHALDAVDDKYSPVLADGTIFDDTSAGQVYYGLYHSHNGDTVCLIPYGAQFEMPSDYLTGTYTLTPSTTNLWWNEDANDGGGRPGAYTATTPGDSASGPVLRVLNQFASTLLVEVIDPASTAQNAVVSGVKRAENVAALDSLSVQSGELVILRKYYSTSPDGDGSGQILRYDASSGAIVDGGFVFNGPGGNGRYIALDQTVVNASRFGVKGSNETGQTPAIQALVNLAGTKGLPVEFNAGSYLIESTIVFPAGRGRMLRGQGRDLTTFTRNFNGSMFQLSADIAFFSLTDFELDGSGGTGHGISLTDATPTTGSFSPSQGVVRQLSVHSCEGTDVINGNTVPAAGIAILEGLEIQVRECWIEGCEIGVLNIEGQTIHLFQMVAARCNLAGVVNVSTEASSITDCDVVANGLEPTPGDVTWSLPVAYSTRFEGTTIPKGGIILIDDHGTVATKNKLKENFPNQFFTSGLYPQLIQGNWIRTTTELTTSEIIYGVKSHTAVRVIENQFFDAFQNTYTRKNIHIDGVNGPSAPIKSFAIERNDFYWGSGGNLETAIHISGGTNPNYGATGTIKGNTFGSISNASNQLNCTDVVLMDGVIGSVVVEENDVTLNGANYSVTDVFDFAGVIKPVNTNNPGNDRFIRLLNNRANDQFDLSPTWTITRMPTDAAVRVYREDVGYDAPAFPAGEGSVYRQLNGAKWSKQGGGNGSTGWIPVDGPRVTFGQNATSPSVASGVLFRTNNTASTDVSNFSGGADGQRIEVTIGDANTTILNNSSIQLAGGSSWTPASGGTITLTLDGTQWREVSRAEY